LGLHVVVANEVVVADPERGPDGGVAQVEDF
jgi:hypothetical protein